MSTQSALTAAEYARLAGSLLRDAQTTRANLADENADILTTAERKNTAAQDIELGVGVALVAIYFELAAIREAIQR